MARIKPSWSRVSITKGSQSFTYEYDAANQLIRENLYYGNGNSNNATYTYTYDQRGNILKKSRYAYTVSDMPSTALSEISYSYNVNRSWGDLLTSYNGQTITYDSMGNPTSYRGKTLSWEGKQLLSVSQSYNGTPLYEYSFTYNEDGLRTEKTLDYYGALTISTSYYYNGSVLMAMTSGTIYQRFSYDASGEVVSVDYSENSGSTYTTYYYLRNAQGDVVKLIDGSGATVVEYVYDSWGKKLSTTGTLASTLGQYQPFRYRGYVYDEETQWYYLQSRYYDPTTRRFISADVLLSTGQGVLGHNSFAYCNNSPIVLSDSEGTYPVAVNMTDSGGGGVHTDDTDYNDNTTVVLTQNDSVPDHPNFKPPQKGNKKVKNPNGKGWGWEDKSGNVWVWTPDMHGGEGWTVQQPDGGHYHAYPGGGVRYSRLVPVYRQPTVLDAVCGAFIIGVVFVDDIFGVFADEPIIAVACGLFVPQIDHYEHECEVCGQTW